MIINEPIFEKNSSNETRINFNIESEDFDPTLWYEVDSQYDNLVSKSCDAALVALLMPAMYLKEDIYINGTVSEKLIFNIYRLQKLLQILVPELNIISITYRETNTFKSNTKYNATGFSAGIDSYTTLDDYYYNCNLDNYTITHLTYHNIGGHIIGDHNTEFEKQKEVFDKRFNRLIKTVSSLGGSGLPFIKVDSNLDIFYIPKVLNYEQSYTLRNISVALLLQKGIKIFYSSSGYSYNSIEVKKYASSTIIDPIILPLLSTESLEAILAGAEYTRVEKTLKVARLKDAQRSLDVCTDSKDGDNCSRCYKCMRTQFTLDIAGKLKDFSSVFDLEIYEQHKAAYIKKLILGADTSPYSSEIIEYLKRLDESDRSTEINSLIESTNRSESLDEYVNDIFNRAKDHHKNKNLKEAATLYKLVTKINPNHSSANRLLMYLEQMNRT